MTPEEAQDIYHYGCKIAYEKHRIEYTPVNQQKVILAGFQAVIDAVESKLNTEYAEKYLATGYDFAGTRSHEVADNG